MIYIAFKTCLWLAMCVESEVDCQMCKMHETINSKRHNHLTLCIYSSLLSLIFWHTSYSKTIEFLCVMQLAWAVRR